ncbi:MAG: aminomethyl-transferring glycine dehydrogenase [Chitinophagales bacterium]
MPVTPTLAHSNQMRHFVNRHIGPSHQDTVAMLQTIGTNHLEELIEATIPPNIKSQAELNLPKGMSEYAFLQYIQDIAQKNELRKSYIGMGYYDTIVPPVIQRNVLENPGWYTQYTPYQAEIAQGRLEALLNFQTMVCDLTAMPIANASLLDEGTAAAEAMMMLYRVKNKRVRRGQKAANICLVSDACLPTTIAVMRGRAKPLGIELIVENPADFTFDARVFACFLQYPNQFGAIEDYTQLVQEAKSNKSYVVVAADLMSLSLLQPPGEWGADVVLGNTQRFGVPMGYGGPHAAYFATSEAFVRQLPGRIIGVSQDRLGNPALRMALQTREQHIRRDKATSNICTAQALLAIMASMYAVYHGQSGVRAIATQIHQLTVALDHALQQLGYKQVNQNYFDTLLVDLTQHTSTSALRIKRVADLDGVNFRYVADMEDYIGISLDETCTLTDVNRIIQIFAEAIDEEVQMIDANLPQFLPTTIPVQLQRTSAFLSHEVFNSHHSETQMLRYIKHLEDKDLSLTHAMIPLGSCTMKLNATAQLMPISYPQFANLHPFVPVEQAKGYTHIFKELEAFLCEITGFDGFSLQPNSGAQGEYAGLMVIRAYHLDHDAPHRNIALIPSSAHGTNPASAVMAGMKVVVVKCDDNGNIDLTDLKAKAEKHNDNLAALMVTYPSTHGVFEVAIKEICSIIHQHGGLVYMDGANMNAQVGLTSPATIGADVCHLNLHKTFSIPHGGGGPGMGPIGVVEKLVPYLPGHPISQNQTDRSKSILPISAAAWGSASILLISYAYIRLLGADGVTDSTKYAILNANYIKARLQNDYEVLYVGENGCVAHELILDCRPFKRHAGVEVADIAKRLMDYGFHAPTVSFPVPGTIMIEPTESESKDEIDRFCEAMLAIRAEIAAIATGDVDAANNVLKNAPHTITELTSDEWVHPYSRQKAAYPLDYLYTHKFWIPVARVDNAHGDRNLVCTCLPIEAYAE